MLLIVLFILSATTGEKRPSAFDGCDYHFVLEPNVRQQLKTKNYPNPDPPGTACSWSPSSAIKKSRIILSCPILKKKECSAWFRVFRFFDPKDYCDDERFIEYSTGNSMMILYRINETSQPIDPLQCFVSVEDPSRLCNCGKKNTPRIQNGEDAIKHEFTMMAALRDLNKIAIFCGATIISEYYALTAAICVVKKNANEISLVVGEHDRSIDTETDVTEVYVIDKIIIHPDFTRMAIKGFVINDIALVRTSTMIAFNRNVSPACLPFNVEDPWLDYIDVDLVGWGKSSRNSTASKILQKLKCLGKTQDVCREAHPNYPIQDTQMCVESLPNHGTCRGDSGGPVLYHDYNTTRIVVVGIQSTVRLCTRQDKPMVVTRIIPYLDWIVENAVGGEALCKLSPIIRRERHGDWKVIIRDCHPYPPNSPECAIFKG